MLQYGNSARKYQEFTKSIMDSMWILYWARSLVSPIVELLLTCVSPISIKKCQDDEGFDITGSEILGNLFVNAATIRIIQALAHPTERDSVPPTSALRYNPPTELRNSKLGKRAREVSVARRSASPQSPPRSKKRQKVADVDPDRPLPSLENGLPAQVHQGQNERSQETNMVPDSQDSVDLDIGNRQSSAHRTSRDKFEVPGTPSPSPPQEDRAMSSTQHHLAERYNSRSTARETEKISNTQSIKQNEVLSQEGFVRAQSITSNPPRAKSASYHITRPIQRGTSVSTAAISPLFETAVAASGVVNGNMVNGTAQNGSEPPKASLENFTAQLIKTDKSQSSQFVDEDSLYDNVPSDNDEAAAAILNSKKAGLRMRQSPKAGLPGLNFTNGKYNTPPSIPRRTPGSREQSALGSPGELPLTPRSKARIDKERQDAADVRKAKTSAAQAAEKRRREDMERKAAEAARIAEEKKAVEATRVAEEDRAKREELERLEIKDFQRAQAEQAEIAVANRLKKEQADRERQAAEERAEKEKQLEEQRAQEQKVDQERLEQEAKASPEKERLKEERAGTENATTRSTSLKSPSPQVILPSLESGSRGRRSMSGTPGPHRAQSSTAFIPSGRKSSLRVSQASSSPAKYQGSPESTPSSTGIETQIPLPKPSSRRVSFAQDPKPETPISPATRMMPPKAGTSKPPPSSSTNKRHPQITSILSTPSLNAETNHDTEIVPVTKQSSSPIMPPSRVGLFKGRSATPVLPPKIATKVPPPKLEANKSSALIGSITKNSPVLPPVISKAAPKPNLNASNKTETVEISSESESESQSESESESGSGSDGDDNEDVDVDENQQVAPEEQSINQGMFRPLPSLFCISRLKAAMITPTCNTESHFADQHTEISKDAFAAVESSSKLPSEDEDSSDEDSEEDIPAMVTPKKLAARAERTSRSPSVRKVLPEETNNSEKGKFEKDQDRETTASSAREASRSPIIFSQHPQSLRAAKSTRAASLATDSSSEEEDAMAEEDIEMTDARNSDTESDSDQEQDQEKSSDEEMIGTPTEVASTQVVKENEPESISDEEDNEEKQVPDSSPQLPRHKQSLGKPPISSNEITSKDYTDKDSGDTQEELAQQLTSSMYEARPSVVSSSIRYPPSSSVAQSSQHRPPPPIRFGTKLSDLAAKQSRIPSSTRSDVAGSRPAQNNLPQDSDQEVSEDESDDSSSSSEESEEERPAPKSVVPSTQTNAKKTKFASSNSNSDSDSSDETVDEQTRIRNEVMASITRKARGNENSNRSSVSNSIASKPSTTQKSQSRRPTSGYGLAAPKKKDPYVTGYTFSQPK
jgi:hypothetical protein